MFNLSNNKNIELIRKYFDEIFYTQINYAWLKLLKQTDSLYPDFTKYSSSLGSYSQFNSFIFSFFRMGQQADEHILKSFIPLNVINALSEVKLIVREGESWNMPGIGVIPWNGLYIVASLPYNYPTNKKEVSYFTLNPEINDISLHVQNGINKKKVLEIDSQNGVLGILCAKRGASSVNISSLSTDHSEIIKLNLLLNNVDDKVSIINTDLNNITENYNIILYVNQSIVNFWPEKYREVYRKKFCETNLTRVFTTAINILSEDGQFISYLRTFGSQHKININDSFLEKFIKSHNIKLNFIITNKLSVLYKINEFLLEHQNQWQSLMEVVPNKLKAEFEELVTYIQKHNSINDYLYEQVLTFTKYDKPIKLVNTIFNEVKTDPLYAYSLSNM